MKLKKTDNQKFLEMVFADHEEYIQISSAFVFTKRRAKFLKSPSYGDVVNFVTKNRFIPIQMWQYLYSVCKRLNYSFEYEEIKDLIVLEGVDVELVRDIYKKAITTDPKSLTYDEDQFQSILGFIQHNYVKQDLSVAYGKTLVFFVTVAYLMLHNKDKFIIILPKPSLATQLFAEFMKLSSVFPELSQKMMVTTDGGDMTVYDRFDCLITNFQYAWSKDDKHFERFTVSIIDEVHRASSKSYKTILEKCKNLRSTKGGSGTIVNDGSYEAMAVIASSGFTFKKVRKREIIDSGRATDGKVIAVKLNTLTHPQVLALKDFYEAEPDPLERLNKELDLLRRSQQRLEIIKNFALEFSSLGNGVVFFKDVKNQYGRKIADSISYGSKTLKVFYIDQHVKQKIREEVYEFMRNNTGCVLVVSYDIASTGLNVKNLTWGMLGEPMKSVVVLGQVIGRFMRKHEDKEKFYLIDFIDQVDTKVFGGATYMTKWWDWSRKLEYEKDNFEIETRLVEVDRGLNW